MVHGIDQFLTYYKLQNKELAERLGIRSQQINDWKSGKRNVPKHHIETMQQLFSVPNQKIYLFDVKEVSDLDRLQIGLLMKEARLKKAIENNAQLVMFQLESDVKLAKGYIKILELTNELKSVVVNSNIRNMINDDEAFEGELDIIRKLIEEFKEKD